MGSSFAPYFSAFGDWGTWGPNFRLVASRLNQQPHSKFTILLGDNFYPRGVSSADDPLFGLFSHFSDSSDQFYVIAGNHDYETPGSVELEMAHQHPKWVFPKKYYAKIDFIEGSNENLLLCMVFVDSVSFDADSAQQAWLAAQLKECDIPNTLRIVSGHYPVYSAGMYWKSGSVSKFRNAINPILIEHNVHLYLSGHEHQMQALEADGIHYLIAGSATHVYLDSVDHEKIKFQGFDAGFLNFALEDGVARYEFVRAEDGGVAYASEVIFRTEKDNQVVVVSQSQPTIATTEPPAVSEPLTTTEPPKTQIQKKSPSDKKTPSEKKPPSEKKSPSDKKPPAVVVPPTTKGVPSTTKGVPSTTKGVESYWVVPRGWYLLATCISYSLLAM